MIGLRTQVFECLEAHSVGADGKMWTIKRGGRVAAKHPALTANPSLFKAVSAGHPTKIHFEPDKRSGESRSRWSEPSASWSSTASWLVANSWMSGKTTVEQGQELPASHPIVTRNWRDFEKVK
jgi:hypothetical protein